VGHRILIVDDHPSFRASVRVLLESEGFTVVGEAPAVEKHVTPIFSKLSLSPTVEDHRRVLAVLAYLGAGDERSPWPRVDVRQG
jgi:CheY-like chemotaxis protein